MIKLFMKQSELGSLPVGCGTFVLSNKSVQNFKSFNSQACFHTSYGLL